MRLIALVITLILIMAALSFYFKNTQKTLNDAAGKKSDTTGGYIDLSKDAINKLNEKNAETDKMINEMMQK